jgi:hypothetical protein
VSAFPRRLVLRRPAPVLPARSDVEVAQQLERRGVVLLHGRGAIDHLAIGAAGVTVIDAKRYRGAIAVERRAGLDHLVVEGRDCTDLVEGVVAQAGVVRQILSQGLYAAVPVRGVLCFVDGDWPWSGTPEVRGVPVVTPRRAAKLCATGRVPAAVVTAVADALRARLAPA